MTIQKNASAQIWQIGRKLEAVLSKAACDLSMSSLHYNGDRRSEKAGRFLGQAVGDLRKAAACSRLVLERDGDGGLWLGTLSDLAEQIGRTAPGLASWSALSLLFDQTASVLSEAKKAIEIKKHLKAVSAYLYQVHRIFMRQKQLKIW